MNKFDVAKIVIKTLGIISLLKALEYLGTMFYALYMVFENGSGSSFEVSNYLQTLVPYTFSTILFSLSGLYLWFKADALSRRFFVEGDAMENRSANKDTITSVEIQAISFSTVGLFTLTVAVMKLIGIVTYSFAVNNHQEIAIYNQAVRNGEYFQVALQIIIGLILLLGSKRIVKLLNT